MILESSTFSLSLSGVISGALLYIKDDFEEVRNSNFLQVPTYYTYYTYTFLTNLFFIFI
jgi:hypothetical protein